LPSIFFNIIRYLHNVSMSYNIKLSGAVAWGIMAKPPRVNASEQPKGVVLSALL